MATFNFTKNPFSQAKYPAVPDRFTMPGAMYAANIAIGYQKKFRVPKLSDPKQGESYQKIEEQRKKDTGYSNWTEESKPDKKINPITIIDIDHTADTFKGPGSAYDKIILPTVPKDVVYDPQLRYTTIASIARNAPFYHYEGAEDTLAFTIDWYSQDTTRADVLFYCRWLEARAKANAYLQNPHRVILVWGEEDIVFKDYVWIIFQAKYTLGQFHKSEAMLPQQAYQEIILKRVVETNPDYDTIVGQALMNRFSNTQ